MFKRETWSCWAWALPRVTGVAFHAGVGIACFVIGCLLGARIAGGAHERDEEIWPAAVTTALRVQFASLLVFATLWWAVDSDPGPTAKVVFLAMNCLGMGIQSGAILRFGAAAEMTTYTTGMLTATMARLANGSWSARSTRSLHMLAAMVAGAAVGGVLLERAPWSPPLLQIIGLGVIIVLAMRLSRSGTLSQQ